MIYFTPKSPSLSALALMIPHRQWGGNRDFINGRRMTPLYQANVSGAIKCLDYDTICYFRCCFVCGRRFAAPQGGWDSGFFTLVEFRFLALTMRFQEGQTVTINPLKPVLFRL